MKKISLAFCMLILTVCPTHAANAKRVKKHVAAKKLQGYELLVVVSSGWNNLQGKLYTFKRQGRHWTPAFSNSIVLGSKGLALGDGLMPLGIDGAPIKHEGDRRSPAGIFTLGSAFGYADKSEARWIRMHYVRASDTLICVDDSLSVNYNRLVSKDTAKNDYNSYEHMHLKDDAYKWGLFVNHNCGRVVPGDGSCIFMHIWENDHTGTDGCTAMTEAHILRLLRWINPKDQPLLVQMPLNEYQKIRKTYGLPALH